MKNEDYKKIIFESLFELDPNKDLFYSKMKNNFKDPKLFYGAPVNPLYFENIDSKRSVVLTNEVYETLLVIDDYNFRNKKEVPFVLYGIISKGGAVVFNNIDCDFKKLKDDHASFINLDEYLDLKIRRFELDNEKNKVICIGHTHPYNGSKIAFNYSLMDLITHLHLTNNKIFLNSINNNLVFSLMKSITKDFNFIYYDAQNNRFYKVDKVYLQIKKKEFKTLSAYNYCDE